MHSAMMRKPSARRTGVLPAAVASAGLSVWPDSCAIYLCAILICCLEIAVCMW